MQAFTSVQVQLCSFSSHRQLDTQSIPLAMHISCQESSRLVNLKGREVLRHGDSFYKLLQD
jgi:hypothetical protein